jgi:nucleoside-diphosphate-sugar epimerase
MAERALVTGGSGYFGSLLRDRLVACGNAVRVLDLLDADDRPREVEFVQGDIRNPEAVRAACAGIDVVYHNVAQVPLARDARLFHSVNVGGTHVLLDAARTAKVRKIVHTSSSAIFGVPRRSPVDEDTEPHPAEAYGRAKLAAEGLMREAAQSGADVTIVRPRTILGHGRLGIFQILFDWIEHGSAVPVLGGGNNVYQFVHADDLADACIRAGCRPGFAVYHVGADRFGTMRQTLEALCAHARTGSRVVSLPKAPAIAAMKITARLRLSPLAAYHWLIYGESLWFDVSRAKAELGWQPSWSNEGMICDSYDWYLRNKAQVFGPGARSAHRSVLQQGVMALFKYLP